MGGNHGQAQTQDPCRLRLLPRHHPQPATHRDSHGVVTGEPDDRKRSRPVREGAVRKRTSSAGASPDGLPHEQLREIFACRDLATARTLLTGWIAWAQRCRLPAFVKLAKTITRYRQLILNAVEHGLSNARVEATNTHLRLLTRRAYGYRSPESLIAMADLTRGGLCPPLPGRS
jgi:hypothetical protein